MRASTSGDFAGENSMSYPLFQQFAKAAEPWGEVFATSHVGSKKFGLGTEPEGKITGENVTAKFFSALHVRPALGRIFGPHDDSVLGGNAVAVLSDAFWKRRFQADPSVLGRTIYVDEAPYTVVGVAQAGFLGSEAENSVDVWVPATAAVDKGWLGEPNINWLRLLARVRPGTDTVRAQASIEGVLRTHITQVLMPDAAPRFKMMLAAQHMTLRPAPSGLATTGRKYEKPLLVLLAVVGVVLLIACGNIANLILARNATRQHEIEVRLALGASRGRIARQLFTESLMLALAGAACAVGVAAWMTRLLISLLPPTGLPLAYDVRPDFTVLGFTAAVAVMTAVVFGLAPAFRAARAGTRMNLRDGRRITGSAWSGRLLTAGQLALSLPLLVGAGLFLQTLRNLQTSDLGFRPESVTSFAVDFPKGTAKERMRAAYEEVRRRLESHAGVAVAGYAWPGLYGNGGWSNGVVMDGHATAPGEDNEVGAITVSPGLFEAAGMRLLQGRYLNSKDQAGGPPVVVVNESFARYYFGSEPPLGRRIRLSGSEKTQREIVGVVRDAKHYGIRARTWRMVYVPGWQDGTFYVRASLGAQALRTIIRGDTAASDKLAQVGEIHPFEEDVNGMISQERLMGILSSVFGALACLLASVGLYGVVAYGVSRRTNEFGIRIALGAGQRDIRRLVVGQMAGVITAGIAMGAVLALVLGRALSATIAGMLYGIEPTDVLVFAAGALWLGAIALVAAFLPARRAARVDPMTALRYE